MKYGQVNLGLAHPLPVWKARCTVTNTGKKLRADRREFWMHLGALPAQLSLLLLLITLHCRSRFQAVVGYGGPVSTTGHHLNYCQ